MNGFEDQLKQRILAVVPHVLISESNAGLSNWRDLAVELEKHSEVISAHPLVTSEGLVQSYQGVQGILIQGVDGAIESKHSLIAKNMLAGSFEQLQAGQYKVIISRSLARKLNVGLMDKIRLMVTEANVYTPFGTMPAQRLFQISGIFELGSEVDDKVAIVNIADLARLIKKPKGHVSQLRLYLTDAFTAPEVGLRIAQTNPELTIENWRKSQGKLFAAVKMEKTMMSLMLMLIIAVAIFNIVSALVMLVNDKKSDVAILRTLGLTSERVARIFMFNGIYNGVLGAIIGVAGGLLLCIYVNDILSLLGIRLVGGVGDGLPVLMHYHQVALIGLGAAVLSFLATLYPSYYVSKLRPADVLREE